MEKKITFSEDQISGLFGELAAEDEGIDQFKENFFKVSTYDKIHNERPLRILVAHKGIGKSALLRMSYLQDKDKDLLALWVQPNDIGDLGLVKDDIDQWQLIEKWKEGLYKRIIELVFKELKITPDKEIVNNAITKGLALIDAITSVMKGASEKLNIDESKKIVAKQYLKNHQIYIYIDDLDRAWEGTSENVKRISALLNAVRDISNQCPSIRFRISLRSDVYYLVRTADESTDKIDGNVIWLNWTQHELLVFLVKRVRNFLGDKVDETQLMKIPQFELVKYLSPIMDEYFMGEGKWNHKPIHYILLSLTRRRPRDLVNLCTQAAREANDNKHTKIKTNDWEAIFPRYSQDRLQDTINEHRYELPEIERLLLGMKPSHQQKKQAGSHKYSDEMLLRKIDGITQKGAFKFANGKKASSKELRTFMYKINFLVARKDAKDGYIDRKFFEDNKYLSTEYAEFGYEWEVHPAFRWALYPESQSVFSEIELPNMDL